MCIACAAHCLHRLLLAHTQPLLAGLGPGVMGTNMHPMFGMWDPTLGMWHS